MSDKTKVINSWFDIGIDQRPGVSQTKTLCPDCSANRTNKTEKCFSVSFEKGIANCHNCFINYVIKTQSKDFMPAIKNYSYPEFEKLPLSNTMLDFFKSRGIEERTLQYFKVSEAIQWMYEKTINKPTGNKVIEAGKTQCVAFNYYLDGVHVNTKFRGSYKRFSLVKDAKLCFYNIDAIKNSDECFIQEGEIDTMTAYQCNIFNSISVPNGAAIGANIRLEYVDNNIDFFENKKKIVIATDGDLAGRTLRDELIRRFGSDRCWTIEYPDGCKDTNEVLLKYGSDAVREMYHNAKQLPLEGVYDDETISQKAFDYYLNGPPKTDKIGYNKFDELFSFKGGELTIITGVPSHGKTTFLDQMLVRLAARHDWRTGIFSPENDLPVHVHKLICKYIGEPSRGFNKMDEIKLRIGIDFVNDHFYFMKYDEMNMDIDSILAKAKELVSRKGINSLVIDPYNCIEHKIPKGYSETQYISELLSKLTTFAKLNYIHIFLVAHPVKMEKMGNGLFEVPNLYKISGSSNFYSKTDNGIVVYLADNIVQVHIQKVKFDHVGDKGMAEFIYDKPTGRYAEIGDRFESELEQKINRDSKERRDASIGVQFDVKFVEQILAKKPEPKPLTDISKLSIHNSFDTNKEEIQEEIKKIEFQFAEDGSLKPNPDIENIF